MKKNKINIITLGCSKNLVDSENLATQLERQNIDIAFDSTKNDANTVVINTCGFISDAKEESIDMILGYIQAKERKEIDNLYVFGCLSERYKKDLEKEIPEVDQYFGVNNLSEIAEKLGVDYKKELLGERITSTPKHFAYLKVSEGCDRSCSFCAIPLIRGKHQSVPIETLVAQANFLAKQGVRELILIAQDLTYYGIDIYKKQMLAELLKQLSEIKELKWIRLHYAYPAAFPNDVIEIMNKKKNICNYIDIPIQHISDNVLEKMKRGHSQEVTKTLIAKLRKEIPNITIRTTVLVGHPYEKESDFEELKDYIQEIKFDRLGVFTYSEEKDTYSEKNYKDNIPQEIKDQRAAEIMELQQQISFDLNQQKIGTKFIIVIDKEDDEFYFGRTEFDSPEVDNEVMIQKTEKELIIGNFYEVKISSATEFDLFAEIQ